MTPQEAKEAVSKYGSQRAAARALKVTRHALEWALRNEPSSATKTVRHRGLSRSQFAAAFDNDTRCRLALRSGVVTLTDDEEIIDDAQFRTERCKHAPTSGWRRISEEAEFAKFRFSARGKIFWSTQTTKRWALANVEGAIE
jgi:hypothetical protein